MCLECHCRKATAAGSVNQKHQVNINSGHNWLVNCKLMALSMYVRAILCAACSIMSLLLPSFKVEPWLSFHSNDCAIKVNPQFVIQLDHCHMGPGKADVSCADE